jgi:hypothetical protein
MCGLLNYKVFALLALMLSCKNTKDFDCLDFFNTPTILINGIMIYNPSSIIEIESVLNNEINNN